MKKKSIYLKRIIVIILILLISFLDISAQVDKIEFSHLTTFDGLSNNNIKYIIKDSKGLIWIGTEDGLNCYNGYEFSIFRNIAKDSTSLCSNYIHRLLEDNYGNIWVGTRNGLSRYNRSSGKFTSYFHSETDSNSISNKSIASSIIKCIYLDSANNLWVGTTNSLSIYKKETDDFDNSFCETKIKSIIKTPICYVSDLIEDYNGNLWIAITNAGILIFDNQQNRINFFEPDPKNKHSINNSTINRFFLDKDNNMWFVTQSAGISLYNREKNNFTTFLHDPHNPNSIPGNLVVSICQDENGNLWLATNGGIGILNYKSNIYSNIVNYANDDNSLLSNSIDALYKDNENRIWIGSRFGGVDIYDKKKSKFMTFKYNINFEKSLSHNNVTNFAEDKEGNIWVSTDGGGLNYFNTKSGKFIHYMHDPSNPNSLTNNKTLSVHVDDNQNVWIGMWGGGINVLNPLNNTIKRYKNKSGDSTSLSIDNVFCIYEDSRQNIWVGLWEGGLMLYDKKNDNFIQYPLTKHGCPELRKFVVKTIYEDKDKNLWLASANNGLYRFDTKKDKFKLFKHDINDSSSISSNSVLSLLEDTKSNLWIGTDGAGLCLFNKHDETFFSINKADGLPNEVIHGIVEDSKERLWLSTNYGISRFTPPDDLSKVNISDFKNYDVKDGLQDNQFNYWAYFKSSTNKIFFGGIKGFNMFYPDSISKNLSKPPIVFTRFSLFNKVVSPNDINSPLSKHISETTKIVLEYWQSVFSFEFAALNYTHSKKNQYAFKMEGFEDKWNYVGTERKTTYTNLDPGEYTFRVKASNNDDVWNEKGISLKIIVTPPWWKTWWFRLILISIILIITMSLYLWKVNSLKQRQRILEKKVTERTCQLQEANADLEEKQEEIYQQHDEILKQSDELIQANLQLKDQKNEIEKSYKNSQTLSEFGQKLTAILNISCLGDMFNEYVCTLMPVSAFGIGIYNIDKHLIEYIHFIENETKISFFAESVNSKTSLIVWCLDNQKPVHINDLENEYNQYIDQTPEFFTTIIPNSIIHIPLSVEKKKIGILSVYSSEKNSYKENEFTNLQTIASYLAIALDNASAYKIIDAKNKHIEGSIRYAQTIQHAILPPKAEIDKYFENFILFRPKDIVSGDFYWMTSLETRQVLPLQQTVFIAAVDCTGHGVPGAFMSMIGSSLLDEIIEKEKIYEPMLILTRLNEKIQKALRQDQTANDDGMDVSLVRIIKENNLYQITFSGAKRPLFYYDSQQNKLVKINGNIKTIGGYHTSKIKFTQIQMAMQEDDIMYLTSDGFMDQNNKMRRPFGNKDFIKLANKLAPLPMNEQFLQMEETLTKYMGNEKQRDDITVVAIKL